MSFDEFEGTKQVIRMSDRQEEFEDTKQVIRMSDPQEEFEDTKQVIRMSDPQEEFHSDYLFGIFKLFLTVWQTLCCLPFFDLRIMMTCLVSSNHFFRNACTKSGS
jgi:hypothetical protein